MSGITPLTDTLLATRLAQRVDLVPLRGALEIADPSLVPNVEKLNNDIRLPSRAARQQSLGQLLLDSAGSSNGSPASASARGSGDVTLSVAVRALNAILETPDSRPTQVLAVKPLWPHSQPPPVSLLTTALSQALETSGLFYESHLLQFAAGTRTLAQLTQEPQARLEAVAAGPAPWPDAGATDPEPGPGGSAGSATVPAAPAPAVANALSATPPIHSRTKAAAEHDLAAAASVMEKTSSAGLDGLRSKALAEAGIHPEAAALVRQQLELLAVPVFHWVGEAWPGTTLDWEIHQRQSEHPPGTQGAEAPPAWSTRLRLDLPTLGLVEVRLNLAGDRLQLQLAAGADSTLARLDAGQQELPQRLSAVGLQLSGLQIAAMAPASGLDQGGNDAAA